MLRWPASAPRPLCRVPSSPPSSFSPPPLLTPPRHGPRTPSETTVLVAGFSGLGLLVAACGVLIGVTACRFRRAVVLAGMLEPLGGDSSKEGDAGREGGALVACQFDV